MNIAKWVPWPWPAVVVFAGWTVFCALSGNLTAFVIGFFVVTAVLLVSWPLATHLRWGRWRPRRNGT